MKTALCTRLGIELPIVQAPMGVQSVLPSQPPCAMQADWACWCFGVPTPTRCDDKFVKRVL